ncbi:MAG: hypothetical protein JW822_00095 [Spirochaetales bacterium]|nr:hypothetical protein [Spirochaetales bacterium]
MFVTNTKKLLFITILLFLIHSVCWTQSFYTETSYQWVNKEDVPVYMLIPGGDGIQQVTLSLDTNGNSNIPEFFITYPEGHTDAVTIGSIYDTLSDSTIGCNVSLQKTGSDQYELSIMKNPASGDTFGSDEVWGLTVANLGTTNTLDASISFDAAPTSTAGIIPNGCYFVDKASVDVYFMITGADHTNTIHQVNLWIKTDGTPDDYTLRAETYGSDLGTAELASAINTATINDDFGGTTAGVHVEVHNEATGLYRLEITAHPQSCISPGPDCEFDNNEPWQFRIDFTSAVNKTAVSIETFPYGAAPTAINPDPIELYRPPLSIIRSPGNQLSTTLNPNPLKVVVGRDFRYLSDPFDEDKDDGDFTYDWELDGGNFAAHGTEQNPDFDASFDTTGAHTIDLNVTESYPLSTDIGATYADFTYTITDSLALDVVEPEYVLFPYHCSPPDGGCDPPLIDGTVTTDYDTDILADDGWQRAQVMLLQDDALTEGTFRSVRHGTDDVIYLSFEVRQDQSLNQYDAVLIALSPDATAVTPENDIVLLIYPFSAAPPSGADLLPQQVKLGTWNTAGYRWDWQVLTAGAGDVYDYNIEIKVRNNFSSGNAWNMEVKLPVTAAAAGDAGWPDIADNFLFYYEVFRAFYNAGQLQDWNEFRWPSYSPQTLGAMESYFYHPVWWGEATLGDAGGAELMPGKPQLISPVNNAVGISPASVTFTWQMPADTNATSYYLYLSTDADFSGCIPVLVQTARSHVAYAAAAFWALLFVCSVALIIKRKMLLGLSMLILLVILPMVYCQLGGGKTSPPDPIEVTTTQNGLDPDTTYYWKIEAKNDYNLSEQSDVWQFHTE